MANQIRLKFLTDEGLAYLKASFNNNLDKYLNNDHEYFLNLLENNHYLVESKYVIDDFTSKLSFDEITDIADFKNTKIIYDAMKNLPDYIMMDDRLWAAITHTFMWNYVHKRRNEEAFDKNINDYENKIFNSFFTHTKHGKKRGSFVNCVSRMWWAGKLTYDPSRKDPYELTEELFKKGFASSIIQFSSSNIINKTDTRNALLTVVKNLRQNGVDVKRDDVKNGIKYLNLIAGSSLLDLMSYAEIKKDIEKYYKDYYKI